MYNSKFSILEGKLYYFTKKQLYTLMGNDYWRKRVVSQFANSVNEVC